MSLTHIVLLHALLSIPCIQGRKGIGGTEQDWGFISVRPDAHMFWWLYYTTYNNFPNYTDRPLIIWLQGGPGTPSSGYGNFLEIGPLDVTFHKRKGSFVENFNVLFVDNPMGVGYSYFSDNKTQLVKTGNEIGEDLYNFFKKFITIVHPELKNVPIYVFGESYGGKMATDFVYTLMQKEKSGSEKLCNLKILALGDAYISPKDYLNHYASVALNWGLIDKRKFTHIKMLVKQIKVLIKKKKFKKTWKTREALYGEMSGFDVHNILAMTNASKIPRFYDYANLLENIMNGEVKDELKITANVTWKFLAEDVYDSLMKDFVRSATHKVEAILNTTNIKVIVYNGVLDFVVNTAGTLSWLNKLNWKGRDRWFNAKQNQLVINEVSEGYWKRVGNLVFYAILRAGHSVPMDNLPVMNKILQMELLD